MESFIPDNSNMPHRCPLTFWYVTLILCINHSITAHYRSHTVRQPPPVCHHFKPLTTPPFLSSAGYVGMQLVPKTTRNPHQIGGVVLRLGAWSGAGRVWGRATGEEGQTAGPVPVPLPGSLRGLHTSVRQKQTSRRAPAQTGIPWQRFRAEVLGARWRTPRQVSSTHGHCVCVTEVFAQLTQFCVNTPEHLCCVTKRGIAYSDFEKLSY